MAPVQPLRLQGDLREALLARAMLVVNTPYTYGGNTPEGGFDCSGLIQWAVRGIHEGRLPRTTAQWAQSSVPVKGRRLERGDFVFFNTMGGRYSHMGIFVGNGQFVHAPSKGAQHFCLERARFSACVCCRFCLIDTARSVTHHGGMF